ncbi:hypothetical protein CHISP_0401 [Chitinispirillum alkaliphilum]|nr:hypothetical protein CHISP_0401 [Chitinispirillum alkaliphilum]
MFFDYTIKMDKNRVDLKIQAKNNGKSEGRGAKPGHLSLAWLHVKPN